MSVRTTLTILLVVLVCLPHVSKAKSRWHGTIWTMKECRRRGELVCGYRKFVCVMLYTAIPMFQYVCDVSAATVQIVLPVTQADEWRV